ncbi:universal stress protein [Thiohalobacter sp. COW1]|uniref:Universal stress protein n=1 Tax=Thiohalobacter thiocyanaticus TaxID=585455 RepID=A0A1Z4VTE2_9GAMM|nr:MULTISPECIES: universal stress protein [Thiohalobacter]BAZ94598.1 universal stress protein [Thiohalobacter thiocyanaticus]BCO30319.1 universal stress protein [Thiohalobacter sp. COW1]
MTELSPLGRFEQLLLATDGSEYSDGAVRLALELAARCGAALTVMTVVISNPEYDALAPQLAEAAGQEARDIMDRVRDQARAAGVEVETVIRHGQEPVAEILQQSEDMQADLLIMGRRGRRGLARMMVGDATGRICGMASCSVLVAPRAAQMPRSRILVATDGSRYSDAAAYAAGRLARLCELPLTVVSATLPSHSEARQAEAQEAAQRTLQAYLDDGLEAEARVDAGDRPETAIVQAAASTGADLIVVGSHGRSGLQKVLLGSVSERVIGAAPGPVLVVRAG